MEHVTTKMHYSRLALTLYLTEATYAVPCVLPSESKKRRNCHSTVRRLLCPCWPALRERTTAFSRLPRNQTTLSNSAFSPSSEFLEGARTMTCWIHSALIIIKNNQTKQQNPLFKMLVCLLFKKWCCGTRCYNHYCSKNIALSSSETLKQSQANAFANVKGDEGELDTKW